jgi:hypothetical protein
MPLSCAFPSRRRCALRCALVSDGRPRVGARSSPDRRRAQGCGEWLTAAVQGAVIDERSEVSSLKLWRWQGRAAKQQSVCLYPDPLFRGFFIRPPVGRGIPGLAIAQLLNPAFRVAGARSERVSRGWA